MTGSENADDIEVCDKGAALDMDELSEDALEEAPSEHFELDVTAPDERLDKVLARLMPDVSRARIQKWIEEGAVCVNGEKAASVRQSWPKPGRFTIFPATERTFSSEKTTCKTTI